MEYLVTKTGPSTFLLRPIVDPEEYDYLKQKIAIESELATPLRPLMESDLQQIQAEVSNG